MNSKSTSSLNPQKLTFILTLLLLASFSVSVQSQERILGGNYENWTIYSGPIITVQYGETLYSIAKEYELPYLELLIKKDKNFIPYKSVKHYTMMENDLIQIPESYIHCHKDYMTNLKDYKLSADEFARFNKTNRNKDLYRIPLGVFYYTVEKGETAFEIARKFNIHISLLSFLNNNHLNDGEVDYGNWFLSEGELLLVPKKTFRFLVDKGDNLYGISNLFSISLDNLKEINHLEDNKIEAGEFLLIPNSAIVKNN